MPDGDFCKTESATDTIGIGLGIGAGAEGLGAIS